MRAFLAAALAAIVLGVPVSLRGWGMDVHRLITKRAIENLPDEMRPFYLQRAEFVAEHSADPDLWRVVGLKGEMGDEDPSETEAGAARSALPSNPEAARLYAEGISRLQQFDPVGARDLLARLIGSSGK